MEEPLVTANEVSIPTDEPPRKKYPGLGGAIGLLFFVLFLQMILLLGIMGVQWVTTKTVDTTALVTSLPIFIVTYIVTFGGTVLFGWYLTKEHFREVFSFTAFSWKIVPAFIPLILGLAILLFEIMAGVTHIIPVSSWLMELMNRLMQQSVLLALLTGGIIGPFLEEMLFRGLVLRGFLDRYKPWQAILWSSLLFGLLHLNIWQFFSAFILGLLLGWLYLKTRSLWPCFLLHALHNSSITFTGTFVYSTVLGYPKEVVDGTVIPALPLWLVALGLLFIGMALMSIRTLINKSEQEKENVKLA